MLREVCQDRNKALFGGMDKFCFDWDKRGDSKGEGPAPYLVDSSLRPCRLIYPYSIQGLILWEYAQSGSSATREFCWLHMRSICR